MRGRLQGLAIGVLAALGGCGLACGGHDPAPAERAETGSEVRLAGRVCRADGFAASGARVFLESEDGWVWQELARDAQGVFEAHRLGDGAFRVTAIARACALEAGELASVRGVLPGAAEVELLLVLRQSGALAVVTHGTSAVDDVYTAVLDLDGREAARPWNEGHRELREAFPAGRLEPGAYWLHVADAEHALAALTRVEVAEGVTTRVEVELVPATWLEVSAPCAPEPCVDELVIRSASGYLDRASFVADIRVLGRYEERVLLPSRTYHLELSTEEGRASAHVTLSGEPERKLRLQLQ